jgi:hypothetical protein
MRQHSYGQEMFIIATFGALCSRDIGVRTRLIKRRMNSQDSASESRQSYETCPRLPPDARLDFHSIVDVLPPFRNLIGTCQPNKGRRV